jgi:hypothetical protein
MRRERDVPDIVAPGSHGSMNRDGSDVCAGIGDCVSGVAFGFRIT